MKTTYICLSRESFGITPSWMVRVRRVRRTKIYHTCKLTDASRTRLLAAIQPFPFKMELDGDEPVFYYYSNPKFF